MVILLQELCQPWTKISLPHNIPHHDHTQIRHKLIPPPQSIQISSIDLAKMKMANLLSLEEAADSASSESFVSDDDATDGTADSSEDNVEGALRLILMAQVMEMLKELI
jgi:hypothetical protein